MTMARWLWLLAVAVLLAAPVHAEDPEVIPFDPNNPAHVAMQQQAQAEADAKGAAMRQEIIDQWTREGRSGYLDGQLVGDPASVTRQQEADAHAWVDPEGVSHSFSVEGRHVSPVEYEAYGAALDRQMLNEMREKRAKMKEEGAAEEQMAAQDIENAKTEQRMKEKEETRQKEKVRLEQYRPKTLRSGEGVQ